VIATTRTLAAAALAVALCLAATLPAPLAAQDLASFEQKTTIHTLDNGWTFIIVERPVAPVFSFATIVNVGSAQEVPGITGLAHMFEHMAFKGTPSIGTSDYPAEKEALDRLETAYQAYQKERLAPHPDAETLEALHKAFEERQQEADGYVVHNEFDRLLEQQGAVGVNAFTGADITAYLYSLPANKLELFAYLESERFLHPVFREFYKERAVVQEERRLRMESNPIGRMIEQFQTSAYMAHPYGIPTVGYMSDLQSITITDAKKFFDTYYAPSNLTTAVVGDVKAETVIPILEKYFGRIPRRPDPSPLRTVEPTQTAERTVVIEDPSQPFYIEGYHKPAVTDPDQAVYDAIDDLLTNGRTSRLYRRLVRDEQLAVQVQSFSGYPGDKYPNLWAILAIPAPGVTNDQVAAVIHEELQRLRTEDVTDAELEKFKTRARADLIRELDSNQGMAIQLADYQRLFGDWRELFRTIQHIDMVTKEDIRRVATETLLASNRTVVQIVNTPAGATDAPATAPTAETSR